MLLLLPRPGALSRAMHRRVGLCAGRAALAPQGSRAAAHPWRGAAQRGCAGLGPQAARRPSRWVLLKVAVRDGALDFRSRPLRYMSIPLVAGLVGYATNWVGIQMLFYPIETLGPELYRQTDSPYGLFCWQGVVPTKTARMAERLTLIVTERLLSLTEAFGRVDADRFATMLQPFVEDGIRADAPNGRLWALAMRPFLHYFLTRIVEQLKREIEDVLDLEEVVRSAFLRDKLILVELFQEVGRKELAFMVNSGFYFGFALGLWQMFLWGLLPRNWTLPVAGSMVGYVTNWIAIKLIFDPVEPVPVGPFVVQGLFEKRQPEVSVEFAAFLSSRVLTSPRLVAELASGERRGEFEALLRRSVPFFVPDAVVGAACGGLRRFAAEPEDHPAHVYLAERLAVEATLAHRLRLLAPAEFESLLHPVFQEDEIVLIIIGGILGFATGVLQFLFNFGGPTALRSTASALHR